MIKYLTGYTSGVKWFDYVADITVGVMIMAIIAMIVWWLFGDRSDHDSGYVAVEPVRETTSAHRVVKKSTAKKIT